MLTLAILIPKSLDFFLEKGYKFTFFEPPQERKVTPMDDSVIKKHPCEITVEWQLQLLRRANDHESELNPHWVRIPEETFARLQETAPAWPKDEHIYRSLRIRFGEGSSGVARTFEAHCTCLRHAFHSYSRWDYLKGGNRLRLLVGDHTHKPCVEWIVADFDTHRRRGNVTAVRGPTSLADELIVAAWMFGDAIFYNRILGFFAAGYEASVPKYDNGKPWERVVGVVFDRDLQRVRVSAASRNCIDPRYSVPSLQQPHH